MGVLSNLEPKNVFRFFEEICSIPHGSGNVDQISDYLVKFAKERNLFYVQDHMKNVIMIKEATEGYENQPPVILQGHMDMVAVKKPDYDIDLKTEGLRLAIDGDKIYAEGTSLGGDDGIAVAYGLALLDADNLKHPRLEIVLTVDEEVGLNGAKEIDLSMLKARRLLNLDSEEEGIFLTSCAGGARVNCTLPLEMNEKNGIAYRVSVEGLAGGHSGADIHKERGNSNCLMGRVIYRLAEKISVGLKELDGGLADNAIPRQTTAVLVVAAPDCEMFEEIIAGQNHEISRELSGKDPDVKVTAKRLEEGHFVCVSEADTVKCGAYLIALPNGVQAMSADMPGMVETSLNLGIFALEENRLCVSFSVRSSVESAKYALISQLEAITSLIGGRSKVTGEYPGWQYRVNSPLRDKMIKVYRRMFGTEPKVEGIHAGLECGILASKLDDLDCVSLGPDMRDIHTTEETLSISSTARVWEYLVKLLEEKDV